MPRRHQVRMACQRCRRKRAKVSKHQNAPQYFFCDKAAVCVLRRATHPLCASGTV